MKKYDIYGIGAAIVDIEVVVSEPLSKKKQSGKRNNDSG